jgi:hypothetical protein
VVMKADDGLLSFLPRGVDPSCKKRRHPKAD